MHNLLLLHKLHLLSIKRDPAMGSNRSMMVIVWVAIACGLAYLAFIGYLFGSIVDEYRTVSGFGFIGGILPFILCVDFFLRLGLKKTPAQQVRPFLLLPISKYTTINVFLIEDLLSPFNLIWQAFIIPYAVIAILPSYGVVGLIEAMFGFQLVILIVSQFYQLVRALTSSNILWWILPVAMACLMALPFFVNGSPNIIAFLEFYAGYGDWLHGHPLVMWTVLLGILVFMFVVNVLVQHKIIRGEITASKESSIGKAIGVSFLNARSEASLFVRLEIVSIIRNKRLRKTLLEVSVTLVLFSAIITFTHLYDDIKSIWLFYCAVIFSIAFGIQIMCKEGNYIDCLMVNKGSISSLLEAKYRLLLMILVFQFIVLLPTIIMGVYSLMQVLANLLTVGGMVNFVLFQLAVYNNYSQSLNTKLTGKASGSNKSMQIVFTLIALGLPSGLISLIYSVVNESVGNIIIAIVGLAFILTNRLWIGNITRRMMKRKYTNLDSFRATRGA